MHSRIHFAFDTKSEVLSNVKWTQTMDTISNAQRPLWSGLVPQEKTMKLDWSGHIYHHMFYTIRAIQRHKSSVLLGTHEI